MVRKRTRKTYESDENDSDSDLDFSVEPASASDEPAAKKYSLRERKSTSAFTSDFDYYGLALDDEDGDERKGSTDDEDFEIDPEEEAELLERDATPPPPTNVTVSTYLEEPTNSSDNPDGLIDFEDMIRADIVVNRNRIDYDNLIQKTEIKMTVNKKRGRKPKNYAEYDLCPLSPEPEENDEQEDNLYEPEADEEEDDDDGLDGDAKKLLQPEVSLSENEPLPIIEEAKLVESDDKDEDDKQVKEHLAVIKPKEVDQPKIVDVPQPPPEPPQAEEEEEEDDDDVIVLGEVRQDVIVLDD